MATITATAEEHELLRNTQAMSEPELQFSAVPTAELAECCCPDFCERDHDNE